MRDGRQIGLGILTVLVSAQVAWAAASPPPEATVGAVRVQFLSPTLLRLEQRGPKGFEDRKTFLVVNRDFPGVPGIPFPRLEQEGAVILQSKTYQVRIPSDARDLFKVEVTDAQGNLLYKLDNKDKLPARPVFPAPGTPADALKSWALADSPRVVPPAWGATTMPADAADKLGDLAKTSGWDLTNDAPDLYVFLPGQGGYVQLRQDFLHLTGPVPLPPLFAFGYWDSRYHPYTETEALATIDRYRTEKLPLDVFVIDTDWRKGGSGGYDIETKYFPDMKRLLSEAHQRHVKVMFNDHPQTPPGLSPLDPAMLQFRWNGVTGLLNMGLDFWWYDRNWQKIISGPIWGVDKEVWGMALYHDMEAQLRPDERPLIMSNPLGVRNGTPEQQDHPAAHRFPVWWTGDIRSDFAALKTGVAQSVDFGLQMMPYVHQDLGGHTGSPTTECYVRFLEWGCLSPVTRVHCTRDRIRYPWAYGAEAESVVLQYVNLRYRLLPTLYAAARKASDDGTPVLRRCDLEWPGQPEASDDSQYLLGDDILVAPIIASVTGEPPATTWPASNPPARRNTPATLPTEPAQRSVWIPPGEWEDAWTGAIMAGPRTITVSAPVWKTPMYVRRGGIILLAPEMQYTGEKPWDTITAEVYPPAEGSGGTVTRELYEDDGHSLGYQKGQFARTPVTVTSAGKTVTVTIGPAQGTFTEQLKKRDWIVRIHLDGRHPVATLTINGKGENEQDLTARGLRKVVPARTPLTADTPSTEGLKLIPLQGRGAAPGFLAGAIMEFPFPAVEPGMTRTIQWEQK